MSDEETPREEFDPDPIKHAEVQAGMTVQKLVEGYGNAGIGASSLSDAVDIYAEMLADDEALSFLSLAGAMVPGGMRSIVADLIRDGHVDVLVTTGANLTHDAIEAIGGKHHHGRESAPDQDQRDHDEQLREEGVDRIYNVYLPQEHFAEFEEHMRNNVLPPLAEKEKVSIQELTAKLGEENARVNKEKNIDEDSGIAAAAYENGVPIYCPAVQDSILGLQAWMHSQISNLTVDALGDMSDLNDMAFEAERAGALLVGGGVPKNYTLQTMLVVPGAYDYGVQLTMDSKQTGGLSGASLEEARSWGKIEKDAKNATVYADATITFPLVVAAAREKLNNQ